MLTESTLKFLPVVCFMLTTSVITDINRKPDERIWILTEKRQLNRILACPPPQ